ncbi:YihY/virulence factor BrkB family protein [Lachnospira sp.]|jgi:membrane protein|uniref:YihY/virulence factor BrkB family protein n=1 Tax=Lachnospira sp. TaxID=2049031 RepID=UPI00257A78A8|nr:YihY/virulence factor BrkB family protein [Lachnospira sp.]
MKKKLDNAKKNIESKKFYHIFIDCADKLANDRVSEYASSACYFIILSIIPFLMALLSLIRYLPITSKDLIDYIVPIFPVSLKPIITSFITSAYQSSASITVLTAIALIWAAGKGFFAMIKGLHQIYEIQDYPNWLIMRIISSISAIIFVFIIAATLCFLVFGNYIFMFILKYLNHIPLISDIFGTILFSKNLLLPIILSILFTSVFTIISRKSTNFLKEIPGGVFAAAGWILFSYLYSLWVENSPNLSIMYGGLTTLVIALMWVYFCLLIIFIGAEINMFLRRHIYSKKRSKK